MAYRGMQSWLSEELKTIQHSGLWKSEKLIKGAQGVDVKTLEGEMINFCANNYLGLADNEEIKQSVLGWLQLGLYVELKIYIKS